MCKKKIRNIGITAVCLLLTGMVLVSVAEDVKEQTKVYGLENTSRYEVQTNRHTQYVETSDAENLLTLDGFEEKMNNGQLSIWYSGEMEALRILDLQSGYIWGCIDNKEEYGLNKKWSNRATSMCYITYFNMEGKEESCAISENVFQPKYEWKKDSVTCKVSAKKLGITFSFEVKLDGKKLTFSMKDESIKETKKSKLSKVSFMSFLGSVYEDSVPGYVLVPDGSGALIRFQKTKSYQSGYSRRVYGYDMAIDQDKTLSNLNGNRTDDYATDEHQLSLPVWGVVHGENQNGFLASVSSGELYTTINAIPAGAENQTVKFTRAYADFVYRQEYSKRVSNSTVVKQPQEELQQINPELTYTFLSGEDADYSGMARVYREELQERGLLPKSNTEENQQVSLMLQVVGSEVKKGFLSNGLARLTTAEEAMSILEVLESEGISNVSMMLSGWNKGGYHGASYGETAFEKEVGSRQDIENLQKAVEKNNGIFGLVLNVMTANEDQIRINQDSALDATLDTIVKTIPNKSLMYPDTYYLRQGKVLKNLETSMKELKNFPLLLENVGMVLNSDYTVKNEMKREEVQKAYQDRLENAEQKLLLDGTNLYLLKYASALTEVPMSCSQYVYETDSVPFLQMVLRGTVDYYAPDSNQGFYSQASILKMIEYGAYPSFMVMEADNFALNDTPLEDLFSLNFQDWKAKIQEVYRQVNDALVHVQDTQIDTHTVEAEGVYKTVYDNGVSIYVNYNQEDYITENGVTVPADGYVVEE